jgi:hypothetical protein
LFPPDTADFSAFHGGKKSRTHTDPFRAKNAAGRIAPCIDHTTGCKHGYPDGIDDLRNQGKGADFKGRRKSSGFETLGNDGIDYILKKWDF